MTGEAELVAGGTVPAAVEVTPETVDAGAEMTISATIPEDWDLAGEELVILDHAGVEQARGTIAPDEEGIPRGGPFTVRAPMEPGEYLWQAVFPTTDDDIEDEGRREGEDDDEAIAIGFPVVVAAHTISVLVWDVPPAIEKGSSFHARVGVRCSSDCNPQGWVFVIRDHEGREVAHGAVGDIPWEGTSALHHAEVELVAPGDEGTFAWTVSAPEPDNGRPHAGGQAPLRLVTVPAADHTLTVVAVDAETGAPVERLKVVAHPFRTMTDTRGVAVLRLPRGVHTVFVSGRQYFPFRSTERVDGDRSIRAELHVDREISIADTWG